MDVNTNNLKTEIKAYGKNRIVQLKAMIEKVKVRIKVLNTYINHQILISGGKVAPPINNDEISDLEELKKWVKRKFKMNQKRV